MCLSKSGSDGISTGNSDISHCDLSRCKGNASGRSKVCVPTRVRCDRGSGADRSQMSLAEGVGNQSGGGACSTGGAGGGVSGFGTSRLRPPPSPPLRFIWRYLLPPPDVAGHEVNHPLRLLCSSALNQSAFRVGRGVHCAVIAISGWARSAWPRRHVRGMQTVCETIGVAISEEVVEPRCSWPKESGS